MKKILSLIFVSVIIFSCNNSVDMKYIAFIENQIESRLKIFSRVECTSPLLEIKTESEVIKTISDAAYGSIDNELFNDSSIVEFSKLLERNKENLYAIEYASFFANPSLIKKEKNVALLRLRMVELSLIDSLADKFDRALFHFQFIKGILVPNRNPIQIGEEFVGELYVAGNFNKVDYKFTINGDSVQEMKDNYVPVFRFKPSRSGMYKLDGVLEGKGRKTFSFPLSYEIEVK